MFTVCPGCSRQFQILAEHIAAAAGQVRCGFCNRAFNVLERLHDEPLPDAKILDESPLDDEPQFIIPKKGKPKPAEPQHDPLITSKPAENKPGPEPAKKETGINVNAGTGVGITAGHPDSIIKEKRDEYLDPAIFLDEPPAQKSGRFFYFWGAASFILLLAAIAQTAWFHRDQVLLTYPELLPYAKRMCAEFNCNLIRRRDAGAITLINRDVRLHPRFKDTLLVNATMRNELATRQPYPRVQLTLFDTAGALIGHRSFVPQDYLDGSIDIAAGMPVGSPVHFVLEVSGPTASAVSFEFRFL